MEPRAKALQIAKTRDCGIRELVQALKQKKSNTIALLRKMDQEQLIKLEVTSTPRKGRPKKHVKITPLGEEFLNTYQKLNLKRLNARKADLDHAAKDALQTCRLVDLDHSPFKIFMELNTIVSHIEKSSKTNSTL